MTDANYDEAMAILEEYNPMPKNKAAASLIDSWLKDDSGHDEETWPILREHIEKGASDMTAPEYTPEQYESAIDRLTDMVTGRNALLKKRLAKILLLEGRLLACHKERDDYQAVSVRLVGELQDCEAANARLLAESRIKEAPDYQAGGWRQHETRRL